MSVRDLHDPQGSFRSLATGEDAIFAVTAFRDRFYIEMRWAIAIDTTDRVRFYMEHELWLNIVVEAESGLEMRSGIGLFWKRDY